MVLAGNNSTHGPQLGNGPFQPLFTNLIRGLEELFYRRELRMRTCGTKARANVMNPAVAVNTSSHHVACAHTARCVEVQRPVAIAPATTLAATAAVANSTETLASALPSSSRVSLRRRARLRSRYGGANAGQLARKAESRAT